MKLVNIHKLSFILLLIMIGFQSAKAQTWTLQQCIDTAQVHNKNLQMSRNNMATGEQKEKEAKANLIPKVAVNADYKYFANLPYQLLPLVCSQTNWDKSLESIFGFIKLLIFGLDTEFSAA